MSTNVSVNRVRILECVKIWSTATCVTVLLESLEFTVRPVSYCLIYNRLLLYKSILLEKAFVNEGNALTLQICLLEDPLNSRILAELYGIYVCIRFDI
jgi:hypothetical protein